MGGGRWAVVGGLAGVVGCCVVVLGWLSLSARLSRREEVRAEMSGFVVVEVTSLCGGPGVKPERQSAAGSKSSVTGNGTEVHVVSGGSVSVTLRWFTIAHAGIGTEPIGIILTLASEVPKKIRNSLTWVLPTLSVSRSYLYIDSYRVSAES